jgi:rhodanese-related sulfurtransferase
MRRITSTELKTYLETTDSSPILLDVREPWEFQTCHIEGALHIPMGQIPTRYQQLDPSKEIVVICHHGMRSLQVAQFLEKAGFKNIVNLTGGVDAWAREVDANMPVY